jgi:hypothetical protein
MIDRGVHLRMNLMVFVKHLNDTDQIWTHPKVHDLFDIPKMKDQFGTLGNPKDQVSNFPSK